MPEGLAPGRGQHGSTRLAVSAASSTGKFALRCGEVMGVLALLCLQAHLVRLWPKVRLFLACSVGMRQKRVPLTFRLVSFQLHSMC